MLNYLFLGISAVAILMLTFLPKPGTRWLGAVFYLTAGWIIFYAVIAPLLAIGASNSPYLLHRDYYGTASLTLCYFLLALIFCMAVVFGKKPYVINLDYTAAQSDSIVAFSVLFFSIVGFGHKYQRDIFSILFIPALMAAYCAPREKAAEWLRVIFLHLTFLFLGFISGFLMESKERIITSLIFAPLAWSLIRANNRKAKIISAACIVSISVALFPLASAVVRETRSQNIIQESEAFSEERYQSIIERIAVIDATSAAVENEHRSIPFRPDNPWWALTGFLGQVGPTIFSRPDHAREALLLTGYATSSDEVNIALTVPGHFLWALGWIGLFFGSIAFWLTVLLVLRKSAHIGSTWGAMFFFFTISQIPRLESVGYAYIATSITTFIAYKALSTFSSLIFHQKAVHINR